MSVYQPNCEGVKPFLVGIFIQFDSIKDGALQLEPDLQGALRWKTLAVKVNLAEIERRIYNQLPNDLLQSAVQPNCTTHADVGNLEIQR